VKHVSRQTIFRITTMPSSDNMSFSEVLRSIIEESLDKLISEGREPKLSKKFLFLAIEQKMSSVRLFNVIANYKPCRYDKPSDDIQKNMMKGAKKVFRDGIRSPVNFLPYFRFNDEGMVVRHPVGFVYVPPPPKPKKKIKVKSVLCNDLIEYNGQKKTLTEWAVEYPEVPIDTIKMRLARDWIPERAFTQPVKSDIQTLLDLIPKDRWISDDEIQKLYLESADKQMLIDLYKSKRESQIKCRSKKSGKEVGFREFTDEEMAESGCASVCRCKINTLLKKGSVERLGYKLRRIKD